MNSNAKNIKLTPETSNNLVNQFKTDGIDIVFQNIFYSVKVKDDSVKSKFSFQKAYKQRQILKGISGIFKAGQITAIMGASGAGKTTLLNILACRIHHDNRGRLYANNLSYKYQTFGSFANYVMQNDLLMQTLTVRETLQFAARLKLKGNLDQTKEKVLQLVKLMKLEKCLDTLVGGPILKGISGGERKRTSIAFELISDPQVIFLDQPTSGLDSLTSYIIVSQLRKLAHSRNKTVIMTIHQPNSQTFSLFDNLTVLLEGKIIYQNKAQEIANYFQRNFNLSCPQFMNPADFFMSKIHYQNEGNRKRYSEYFQAYQNQQLNQIKNMIERKQTSPVILRESNVGFKVAMSALTNRSFINTIRNPRLVRVKIIQAIFMSLYIGGMYFNIGTHDYTQKQSWIAITGFLFFISIFSMTMSISPISLTFPAQRQVFFKQQDSKMYTISEYFLSRNIIELPEHFIIPIITVSIYYFMVNLSGSGEQFWVHTLIFGLMSFCGASLGLFLGSVVLDQKDVAAIIPIILLPMITFSGFFKNRDDLPPWIGWIQYLSPNKYSFIGLADNEVLFKQSNIEMLNFDISKWEAIGILLALGIVFRLLSLFCLWYMKKKTQ